MSLNVAGILRESAKAYPDKPALIFDGGRITYAELDEPGSGSSCPTSPSS